VAFWRVIILPGHRITKLRAFFEGKRTSVKLVPYNGRIKKFKGLMMYRVRVDMHGLHTGVFAVKVVYVRSIRGGPFRLDTRNHLYRTCFQDQNPKGGLLTGLNRLNFSTI
jgi:hypothetical protein